MSMTAGTPFKNDFFKNENRKDVRAAQVTIHVNKISDVLCFTDCMIVFLVKFGLFCCFSYTDVCHLFSE